MSAAVAVIVPVHSAAPDLRAVVRSVSDGDDLIVVDDGSPTPVRCEGATVIRTTQRGPAAARNTGAASTTADVLLFVDADDEPLDRWRDVLVAPFQDPHVAIACGSVMLDRAGSASVRAPASLGPAFGDVVALFLAGAFAVRREVFVAIGGYDEELEYAENAELGMRLTRFCREHELSIVEVDATVLRVHVREPDVRRAQYAEARVAAVQRIFDVHGAELGQDRHLVRDYASVAGASAAFLGRHRAARRWFGRALREGVADWRGVARYVLSSIPLVRARVWRGSATAPPR